MTDHRQIIERYFNSFRERDREALRAVLTADFHHISSFGEWRDRDAMIEAIWPGVGSCWATDLEIFGEVPCFMVRYQHESLPDVSQPRRRIAEFIRFDGERIAEIEVYLGREVGEAGDG
jgi:ketosteroid isomerase-like protein